MSRRRLDLLLFAEDKREAPTPRRRERARREGHVFRSVELTAAVVFLAGYAALRFLGPDAARGLAAWAERFLAQGPRDWSVADLQALAADAALAWARATLPFLALALALVLLLSLLQTGFHLSAAGLAPRFSALNPVTGLQRLFSLRGAVELLKAVFKVAVILLVAWSTLREAAGSFPVLAAMDTAAGTAAVGGWVDRLAWRVGLAFLALAAADWFYQRWEYERSLRMTRSEVREELRETEGDPAVRGARRRRQRELARQRMIQEVRRATVVVTNPDHYAVALRYVPGETAAPVVVAKGRGRLAERIREEARRHGVVLYEDPPLARALYRAVPVGRAIPAELYEAVAEVLAFVWRLKGYRVPAGA